MMKFKKMLLLVVIKLAVTSNLLAQIKVSEYQFGYFSPYFTNNGASIGIAFDASNSYKDSLSKTNNFTWQYLSELKYFFQPNTSNNVMVNPEIVLKFKQADTQLFVSSSFGVGYLLSFQKQEGALNLATGTLDYDTQTINYFLPNLNIAFGLTPKKYIGFYVKTSYGAKLSLRNTNAAFIGFSTGLIFKLKSNG